MDANGTMLRIVRVGDFTPSPFTILGWQVTDIDQTVAGLTAKGLRLPALHLPRPKALPASGPHPATPPK